MTARKPGRPAKDHRGRQRKLACPECGFICYASATAVREHGLPICGQCRLPLVISHGRDAVKVSREAALRYLVDHDDTRQALEQEALSEYGHQQERAAARAERESRSGFVTRHPCGVCGRFKSEPAAVCPHCGDDPMPLATDRHAFNRGYGAAA